MGSGRSAGYAIGEARTSPCRAIKPGIRGRHVPGLAQARAGSPDPSRGTCKPQRRAFIHRHATAASTPFQAPKVCPCVELTGDLHSPHHLLFSTCVHGTTRHTDTHTRAKRARQNGQNVTTRLWLPRFLTPLYWRVSSRPYNIDIMLLARHAAQIRAPRIARRDAAPY